MAFENIEASFIAQQLLLNIGRITTIWRDNATAYKAQITAGQTAGQVGPVMKADAQLFLNRIQTVVDLATRNNVKYQAALTSLGWPAQEVTDLRSQVVPVANHTIAATLNNATQVNNEADFILTNVPQFERTF